jgi:hypothetical protein
MNYLKYFQFGFSVYRQNTRTKSSMKRESNHCDSWRNKVNRQSQLVSKKMRAAHSADYSLLLNPCPGSEEP